MKRNWLQLAMLRAASLLVWSEERAEWLDEWRSELWYVPRQGSARFCLGAFRDALWLRRNCQASRRLSRISVESPLQCLAFLAITAAVALAVAILLAVPLKQL